MIHISKNKNISNKIPIGTTFQTRDEHFNNSGNYRKPGYERKGFYRKGTVIDSNSKDELAIVKSTTSKKALKTTNSNFSFRPYVETLDCNSMPIKEGKLFKRNKSQKSLSFRDVNIIKKECVKYPENREKSRKLKGRK